MRAMPKLPPYKVQRARRCWDGGMDTSEIAWQLVASEAQVYNSLAELHRAPKEKRK